MTVPVPTQIESHYLDAFLKVPGVLFCILGLRSELIQTNESWNTVLGYSDEQLQGLTLLDIVHPSDLDRTLGGELELHGEAPTTDFTVRCRHQDGSYRWIHWHTHRGSVPTETFAIGVDSTSKSGVAYLGADGRSRRSQLAPDQILFEANPNPMWVYDLATLRFLEVNDAAVEHYGYSRAEFLSMTLLDIRPPEDVAGVLQAVKTQEVLENPTVWTHLVKSGAVIQVEILVRNIDYRGFKARLASVKDITEQRKAKSLLERNNEVLEQRVAERTQQLVAANRELEAFCFSVSHDLRAPLRAIDGFSHAVLKHYGHVLGEVGIADLERVRKASQRMSELIDALLGLTRLTRQELRLQEVDLSTMARLINEEIRAENPNRVLQCRIQPDMVVQADPRLMHLLLQNLLSNAWKFTAKQPKAEITFECRQSGSERVFSIRDNGAGFDMAYADKLFQPFQRLHHASEFSGNGVGLAMVNRIVSRHGGRTFAHGLINHGATVYFTLGTPNSE